MFPQCWQDAEPVGQGPAGGAPKEEEKMEERGRGGRGRGWGKYGARHASDKPLCHCWFSGLGGAVNSAEAAAREAAFPTLGLASARSSLLRDWFPCAGAVLSLAQTHRGRPQTTSPHRGRPQATSPRLYAGGELLGSPVWQALAKGRIVV